jgi:phosphonate transport system substrate-binding protein
MVEGIGSMQALPWHRVRACIGALLLSAATGALAAAPAPNGTGGDDRAELVLGRTSDDPRTDLAKLQPMVDYVVPRMADVGIRRGRVLMARDSQQMISYLRRGKVDWVTETAGAAMAFEDRAGARIVLSSYREGVDRYASVLVARRDHGIATIEDLRGRSIAFQNASSTSAYFLPATEILQRGLPLAILSSAADRPGSDLVGFLFARTELNIATWVHKGLVDAGALSELDWDNPRRVPPAFRQDLVVFHRSDPVPRALEMVANGTEPAVERRLREVLLAARDDPAAAEALKAYWGTTGFRDLDEPMLRSLARLRAGVARIRAEVE